MNRAAIRTLDVVVAASLLVLLLPLMVLTVIAVRLESPGPAFFRCGRVGYRGRRLQMLKVRKMSHNASGCSLTTAQDARFTRIGGLLTKLKIDEIPQLLHVLGGSMSLVGPRPEAAEFVALHPRDYGEILSVPPGITGLSQIAFVDERRILDPLIRSSTTSAASFREDRPRQDVREGTESRLEPAHPLLDHRSCGPAMRGGGAPRYRQDEPAQALTRYRVTQ